MELLELIDELEDMIEDGSSIPFAGKIMVDKKKVLELIAEVRLQLPDDIKQAQWINAERQRLLAQAQQDADEIINNAQLYIQEQVEMHQIVKEANKKAETLLNEANYTAKEIKIGAREYADNLLTKIQEDINLVIDDTSRILEEIKDNREELK